MQQRNWQQILTQSLTNIREKLRPLLKTVGEKQPDLGYGAGGDRMEQVDLAAEQTIVDTFRKNDVSFTLISEESGRKEFGRTPHECFVTVDPIDGTTNLTRGIPFYATSIAVSTKPFLNTVHDALVADLFHGVTYTAQKGKGAYRNHKKVTPSKLTSLEEAVIGIDLNNYKTEEIAPQLTSLIQKTKHTRHFGANALELCYVADGTTDAFIDIRGKLRTTDIAAAWLILQESGGVIRALDGKSLNAKLDPKQKVAFIASANQKMHSQIMKSIKRLQ